MEQDSKSFGDLFSEKRKEKKLSLKEVESATSIRTNYLEAIEKGEVEKLISPIYAQGFARQYATFLGLDGDKIITEYTEVFKRPISQEFSYGIGTLEARNHSASSVKWIPGALWFVAFGLLAALGYLVARSLELF
jgi:cytoskeletal protein RodZ